MEPTLDAVQIATDPEMDTICVVFWTHESMIGVSDGRHLWWRQREGQTWHKFTFAQEAEYQSTGYYHASLLPNGNLAWVKACWRSMDFYDRDGDIYLVEHHLASQEFTRLSEVNLPGSGLFSWNSTQSIAVYNDDPYEFGALYWVTRNDLQPIPIRLQEGEKSWFLPDTMEAKRLYGKIPQPHQEPYPVGNVNSPLWSPDDQRVFFWATLEPMGKPFGFTTERYWTLYAMDVPSLEVAPLLSDVKAPWYSKLSPDGRHIAYYSTEPAARGIWIYSLERNERSWVQAGYCGNMAWSPDGQALVAIVYKEPRYKSLQLWRYDVSPIVAR